MVTIYELPRDIKERNKCTRLINLDSSVADGHVLLIEAERLDDLDLHKRRIYAYPLDVFDDGVKPGDILKSITGITLNSLGFSKGRIERAKQVEFSVEEFNYVPAPFFSKSPWRWALILPSEGSRLPELLRPLLRKEVAEIHTEEKTNQVLEKQIKVRDFRMKGDEIERVAHDATLLQGIKGMLEEDVAGVEKKNEPKKLD